MVLNVLSHVLAGLGGSRLTGALLRGLPLGWLGRAWLRRAVLRDELVRPDDVTVLIGIRDRADYRLVNALRSIRAQTHYPLRIIVVDYGSERTHSRLARNTCRHYGAEFVRVNHAPTWSRSRCLNIGIRRATTKFVLASDADVILSPRYLSDAIAALKASPFSVICSPMLDLPETSTEFFRRASETGDDLQVEKWKKRCSPRLGWELHPGVVITYTSFFRLIRGYDEYYELWGAEDVDLVRRFSYLGVQPRRQDAESYYLHQWHVKFEGIQDKEQVQRNHAYLGKNHSILRNNGDWGMP